MSRRIRKLFKDLEIGEEFTFAHPCSNAISNKKISDTHYEVKDTNQTYAPGTGYVEVYVKTDLRLHWQPQQEIQKGLGVLYPITYVEYEQGYLARIEYCLEKNNWMIWVFNGLIKVRREGTMHEIERIKIAAELMVRDNANIILRRYFPD